MKHLILGTAGHVDHGKTTLVKALTGIDTDRLKEEKERGITIELGFAHLELPGDIMFGIVDVPGHERFVRTMVAGVGGMDLVMLVIAADEGIMPQTREHLEICRLLGVSKGLVALTKCDMVDEEWLGLVMEEVRDYLHGSFLDGAPIVPVSARTSFGLDQLKASLTGLSSEVEEKSTEGPFRLPVDRIFTVAGFGTVVTGTLLSGIVKTGDEVEILPSRINSRVRGVQTHGKKADRGDAGQRVAVNLQGVDHVDIQRGDVVVPRDIFQTTRTVDTRLTYLSSAPRELKHRAVVRLHSATYEVTAQVILLDRDALQPGDTEFVQLRLRKPVLLLPGDQFIVRTHSPQTTVGGGVVLDPAPPRRRRRSAEALALLQSLEGGEDAEKIRLLVRESQFTGINIGEISTRSGLPVKRLEAALTGLLSKGLIVQMVREPRIFIDKEACDALKARLFGELQRYLDENTLKDGISKEELKSRIPKRSDVRFFGPLLAALEKEGKALVDRDLVRQTGRTVKTTENQAGLQAKIEAALLKGGCEPPTLKELADSLRCTEKGILEYLNLLAREGKAVKIKTDIFYAPQSLALLKEKLVKYLQEKGEIQPPEFRELTGLSRKFMIPLMEYFDQEKVTIRVGDKRVLRKG
jgi:selenocysteine-specific elongation factor